MEYPLDIHCTYIAYNYIAYTLNMPQVTFSTYIDTRVLKYTHIYLRIGTCTCICQPILTYSTAKASP